MSMGKKYSNAEKLAIIKEASEKGVKITLAKYALYPATFYYWKKKVAEIGEVGLTHGLTKERLAIIKKLEKENQVLKEIIAEKELESKLKDELLKKKYPHLRNKL
jgi:putative transposase